MNAYKLRKIYGKNIKYYRFCKGWSQEKLAEKSSLDINTIKGLEIFNKSPSPETTCKIVNALGITPKDFYDEKILKYNLPTKITGFKKKAD